MSDPTQPFNPLTRESLQAGWVQRMVATGDVRVLSEEERAASLRQALARHPAGTDLWLFAYGSLIWNPAFHFVERRVGTVHGLHRRFCLWTSLGRGSPDCPGLVLGLDRGGRCRGVAYRIAAAEVATELDLVWRREMVTGAYRPRWVGVRGEGEPLQALTFVINRRHDRYAGSLAPGAIVDTLATAAGALGSSADYLFNTAAHLEQLGIDDMLLRRLCRLVRDRQTAGASPQAGL